MTTLLERLQTGLPARYRVERQLAEGGMAVVFRATDLTHDRQVAVKVLRPELSAMVGADRFLREIRVTAQLQHPHILPLYDSGAIGELLYYVMPLIEGESLRDRLNRERQLPVDEVVALIRAVASALDYAHRQGVLHRDIKPENILLHDGQPLLADFGIALAVRAAGGERLTQTGLSIGTPSYMSPEQTAGDQALDARTDIYALGCVAYEALAGEPPFTGSTYQAVVAAVMTTNPRPLVERRHTVPDPVSAAIHRALERLPADRFATAAEFASALSSDRTTGPQRQVPRSGRLAGKVGLGILAGLVLGALAGRQTAPRVDVPERRWQIALPDDTPVSLAATGAAAGRQTVIALAPAGDRLAWITPSGSTTALAIRAFNSDSVVTLPGTEGAYHPFFSPDGNWLGFFVGNLLRKVPVTGGDPVTLIEVDRITGVQWTEDDRILLLEKEGFDLRWITAAGVAIDSTIHLATQFGSPDLLPGGEWAVGHLSSGQMALLSLTDGTELAITRRGVLPLDSVSQADLLFGTSPRWLPSGFLVYATNDGILTAMPFDGRRRVVLGQPVALLSGVRIEAGFGLAEFAVADDGTMVYVPGSSQLYATLAFVSAGGSFDTLPFPRGPYTQPRLSPDGTTLAIQARSPVGGWDVWLMNLATGVRQKVEIEGDFRSFPAFWLPSGRQLALGLWDPVQFIQHGARVISLDTGETIDVPTHGASYLNIAPDGESFVFSDWRTGDLYLRSLYGDTTRTRIPARGFAASFSPDGRWVSWGGADGSVAVSPVPPSGAIHLVAERGQMPLWTPGGDALIYRDGSRYYRVPISTAGGFRAGRPELIVEGTFLSTFAWNHDIAPDGRLLVLLTGQEKTAPTLGVITGFPAAVARVTGTAQAP